MRVGKKSGPLHHPALKPANLPDFLAVARKRLLVGAAVLFMEVLQLCRSALISWADMVLAPSVAGLFKWRQFEVGPTLRAGNSAPIATAAPTDQRQLAGGRDLHPGQGQVGVFIPGCRLQRCDDRLPSVG